MPRRNNSIVARSEVATIPARLAHNGELVRVVPDQDLVSWPPEVPLPQKLGIFQFQQNGDGSYRPMLRLHSMLVRMRADIEQRLGLGVSYAGLRQLMRAGFVESTCVTPNNYSLDLASFFDHVEQVRADPNFWNAKNRRRYLEAFAA